MTASQEQQLVSLWESEEFQALIDSLREPEIERQRAQIAIHLADGNMAKACIAQGQLQVWGSELTAVFARQHRKIREKQKGPNRPRG